MTRLSAKSDFGAVRNLQAFVGTNAWNLRLAEIRNNTRSRSMGSRAMQRRHALELSLSALGETPSTASVGPANQRLLDIIQHGMRLTSSLPTHARDRFRERLLAGLRGTANLIPVFHLLRLAEMQRDRGFEVSFDGLVEDAPYDLLITRDGVSAEVACEVVSAEDGRHVHRQNWCTLVDRINPDLHTWLSAHPGRYVLKMTLPEGMREDSQVAELHRRISLLLSQQKRRDNDSAAVLQLDPLIIAGAQATREGLPASLRAQFGPEAHLAIAGSPSGGSVLVLAARSGQEDDISAAVCRRLSSAAETRLTGRHPGILAVFLDDLERSEWRELRGRHELEGTMRRFLTRPEARKVVSVSCTSRVELLGMAPPDAVPDGELRFRNPSHPLAKLPALSPAIASSV